MTTKLVSTARLGLLTWLLTACATLPASGADSWKEEVLLHDGQKIIVERSQIYKGRREPGQEVPAGEHTIRFALPGSNRQLSWTSEYGQDLGRTNFNALALHVKQGVPYLVVEPNLCLSYNKWGRPNPPYVVFKHDSTGWQRIPIADLPAEFKTINLIVNDSRQNDIRVNSQSSGYVPFDAVQKINSSLPQPQYKTILREKMPEATMRTNCSERVSNGNGTWLGLDWFTSEKTLASCQKVCDMKSFAPQYCPCANIFEGK